MPPPLPTSAVFFFSFSSSSLFFKSHLWLPLILPYSWFIPACYSCHNILNESFFYCVLTRMMKEVFSPCPPGMLVLFCGRGWDPDFVFLLQLLFPRREEQSEGSYEWSTLLLFSRFSGDLKLLKVWGWVTAQRCLCDAHQACTRRYVVCYVLYACVQPRRQWGRGHKLHVLKYVLFLWPIISAHTWHLSQIDFIQL